MAEKAVSPSASSGAPGMPGGGMGGMEKSKNLKKAYTDLFRYIDAHKKALSSRLSSR